MREILLSSVLIFLCQIVFAQQLMRPIGVKINVTDMKVAIDFYVNKIGFKITSGTEKGNIVFLTESSGKGVVVLNFVRNLLPEGKNDTRAGLTIQVNDLDSAIAKFKSKGVEFGNNKKRKEGVGYAITFEDPFHTRLSMMHQTIIATPYFDEPKIYNYGFLVSDMKASRNFYQQLGFLERSEKYLPLDMPLGNQDGSFAFMLHMREGVEPISFNSADSEHIVILFQTSNLDNTIKQFKDKVRFLQNKPQESDLGRYISFLDDSGYISELIERR